MPSLWSYKLQDSGWNGGIHKSGIHRLFSFRKGNATYAPIWIDLKDNDKGNESPSKNQVIYYLIYIYSLKQYNHRDRK